MARTSKYKTHVAPRFEEIKDWVRNGAIDEEVAKKLGIAYSTFKEYKNKFSAILRGRLFFYLKIAIINTV